MRPRSLLTKSTGCHGTGRARIIGATSGEGLDFVRCRICGDHLRVISGRHLSEHEIDRETYMFEYRLTPVQLIAKDVRHKKTGNVFAGSL